MDIRSRALKERYFKKKNGVVRRTRRGEFSPKYNGSLLCFFPLVLLHAQRTLYDLYNQTYHMPDPPKPAPRFRSSNVFHVFPHLSVVCPFVTGDEKGERQKFSGLRNCKVLHATIQTTFILPHPQAPLFPTSPTFLKPSAPLQHKPAREFDSDNFCPGLRAVMTVMSPGGRGLLCMRVNHHSTYISTRECLSSDKSQSDYPDRHKLKQSDAVG